MPNTLKLLPEYEPEQFDSRHRLVIAASQRAKQLMQGSKPQGPPEFTKATSIALEEVLNDGVEFLTGKDARQAIKDAKRGKEAELERMTIAAAREDAREIKKELSVYVDDTVKPAEGEAEE